MPTISRFYGIVISMFFNDNEQHDLPHMHVEYSGNNAIYDLDGNLIVGNIPNKQRKLVEAWIEIHKEELYELWCVIQEGKDIFKIEPLK